MRYPASTAGCSQHLMMTISANAFRVAMAAVFLLAYASSHAVSTAQPTGCQFLSPLSVLAPSEGVVIRAPVPSQVLREAPAFGSDASWLVPTLVEGELLVEVAVNETNAPRKAWVTFETLNYTCAVELTQQTKAVEDKRASDRAASLERRFIFGMPLGCDMGSDCERSLWAE